ncbi:AAA family ATPase [Hyphomicrobium sp.]|uniref:bifunctional aminoglycoside phosphotransferase/ATP-binding protein n=1 Tax=Hyphomicrobium sp. TaxID=82 RepID=UPI002D1029B4|nr:AAA family ATPase [Hyphomicrobium sp.]HRN87762.1 AAA family ATPase [Hyphomicrobium sp.]HRQ27846.1 AAA family ATPase [Hyphomicrobium sp.]
MMDNHHHNAPRQANATEDELIAFLSDPASYDTAIESVEIIETHAARVFLAGEKAYKVKKQVTLPFLDFSTKPARDKALSREFELNHPHAPDIYVALASVNRDISGRLTFSEGTPIEPVLVMKRFAQEDLLAHIAENGPLPRDTARALAEMIARYHQAAPTEPAADGAKIVRDVIDQLADGLKDIAPSGSESLVDEFAHLAHTELTRRALLLDARGDAGYVRRCHGDLHLGNIVMQDGVPVAFDALEFDERLATTDVLYDLAFVLMDLDVRGDRSAANAILNAYVTAAPTGGEIEGLATLPLFLATRAAVRGVVALERARQEPENEKRAAEIERGLAYVKAANTYLTPPPPILMAVGGLSGTGKSTLAAALAPLIGPAPGAVVLRTDVERKRLFGVSETQRLTEEHYTQSVSAEVYARLYNKSARALSAGHAVIFDGVSARAEERDRIASIAGRSGCEFVGLWLDAPLDTQVARVGARRGDASDSDATVVRAQAERDLGPMSWTRIDAGKTAEHTLAQARTLLGL